MTQAAMPWPTPRAGQPSVGRLAAVAVVVVGLAVLPLLLTSYQLALATQILIFAMLAMSVDVLAGYAGRTPLCHGAIFGASTYVVIYCQQRIRRCRCCRHSCSACSPPRRWPPSSPCSRCAPPASTSCCSPWRSASIVWGVCLRWTHGDGRRERPARQRRATASSPTSACSISSCSPSASPPLGDAALRQLAVRPDAERHQGQRKPHGEPRLQRTAAPVHRLHGLGLLRRHRRRAVRHLQQLRQPVHRRAGPVGHRAC